MATKVAGDLYTDLDGQMLEIKRQLRQKEGYPFNPMLLVDHLQAAIEGNFVKRNGQPVVRQAVPSLLQEVGIVTIQATVRFLAVERFVLNYGSKAKPGVRISYLGENLKTWFSGKTEEPMVATKLRYVVLVRYAFDAPIFAELGDKAKSTLAQIWALMELQPNGQAGVLLTNGQANIFYVDGRVVDVHWNDGGWDVNAPPVTYPFGWRDGYRVFSRA